MRLQSRIFLWFIAALVCGAMTTTVVVYFTQRDPSERPGQVMARAVAAELAVRWDDPARLDAYVAEVHESAGVPITVVRDVGALPPSVAHSTKGGLVHVGGDTYVPILRQGAVVGAAIVKLDVAPPGLWYRPVAGILVSLIVFAFAARRVSRQIAAPLERVADAADRLGEGNLTARAQVDERSGTETLRVGRAFDAMAARVETLVRDQRELLGAVSHELRSPLGRARVALEIAREQDDKARALDRLGVQLDDLDAILGDLLNVTRAGLSDLQKRRIELGPWLQAELDPELASVVVHGAPTVDADPALLARVVHNLVENARAHGHGEKDPVMIDVAAKGSFVRVSVRDTGPGFAAEILDRAFDPFVRADPARGHAAGRSGVGLGLAIVKRVVVAHGGTVGARNCSPKGAEVWFELPLAPSG